MYGFIGLTEKADLPNGYPMDSVPYLIAITTYSITITINILLLYILYSNKNKTNSSKSITVTILLCLLFTFGRSISWTIGNITLLMMVYSSNTHNLYNILMIISAVGYFFQFLYSLATGYFFKLILEDTFNDIEQLQVNKHFMWAIFSLYCLSAVIYNFFFGLIDGLNKTGYNTIPYYTSNQWFVISPLYNIYILYAFIKRLRKSIKTINLNANHRKMSMDVSEAVVYHNTKQTNLIFFTVTAKLAYDIYSFNGTETKASLIIWHFIYLIGATTTMICILLTMRFNDNDAYYKAFCKCCHSICLRFEKWLFDKQGTGFDYAQLRPNNTTINSGSRNLLFSSRPASDILIDVKPIKQCNGVNRCASVDGICTILTEQIKNDDKLLTSLRSGSYDPSQMINDFNHLISCHDSDSQYNQIYNRLNRYSMDRNHSKYNNCNTFSRHRGRERYTRNRERELTQTMKSSSEKPRPSYREQKSDNDTNDNDSDCIDAALLSIIDNVHSYYFHSYDRNLRSNKLLKTEDQIILTNQVDNADLDDNCQNKFNTNLQKNEHSNVKYYSFGQRFEYEDIDHEWFVDRKATNLKTELVEDEKHNISMRVYKINYQQCLLHMNKKVEYFKKLSNKNDKQILNENHILSLLIYTNCSKYQYEWSASFRQQNHESCDDLKKHHSHFRYASYYLVYLIESFGELLRQSKEKIFFHGVSEFLCFTKTIAEFNGPLSTSEELLVAQRFTSSQGMILEIRYSSSVYPYKARYFDCMRLSDFASERESLFIGGAPRMEIVNIYNVKENYRGYGRYLKAINLITGLLNGEDGCIQHKNISTQQHATMTLCHELLSNQSVKHYDTNKNLNFTKFPEDVAQQINQYCIELHNIVILWHHLVNWIELATLLCANNVNSKKMIPFFNLNVITKIFPNIEYIEYYNAAFKGIFTSKDTVILNIINYILQCKNIWEENKKLKYIVIHHKIPSCSFNNPDAYWKLCRENKKTILYRNDIQFDANLLKFQFDAIKLETLANAFIAKNTPQ